MKRTLLLILVFGVVVFAQDEIVENDSLPNPIAQITDEQTQEDNDQATTETLMSLGLDSGYKGFAWGSPSNSPINTVFNLLPNDDSTNVNESFSGMLGLDSVIVTYAFADSGFWKAEIDFVLNENNVENLIGQFRRLEKNISEVYGPPQSTKQKESGQPGSYAIILDQKFSTA